MSQDVTNSILGSYPSLANIMNLARSIVNDSQPGTTDTAGEGQILTNSPTISPFSLPFLNSSIRSVYRQLRNSGDPQLIKDNVKVTGLTPVNGNNGVGGPDPAVQVFLSVTGYFDGTTVNGNLLLPSDVLYLEAVSERLTGSNNPFVPMYQPEGGLSSALQVEFFRDWEWRENRLYMRGATTTRDIRMRYWANLPSFYGNSIDYTTTYVPIQDSNDAIAYRLASKYSKMLGSPMADSIAKDADNEVMELRNSTVRRNQGIEYHRTGFNEGNNDGGGFFAGGME